MIATITAFLIAAQPIIEVAIELLIIPAAVYFLKQNRDKTKNEKLLAAIDIAVLAAEQMAKRDRLPFGNDRNKFRNKIVVDHIVKKFPHSEIAREELEILIEAAVGKIPGKISIAQ